MKSGDKIQTNIPGMLMPPYDSFDEPWRNWLKSIYGGEVELIGLDPFDLDPSTTIDGWQVQCEDFTGTLMSGWLPTEWLTEGSDTVVISTSDDCSCSTRDLLNFGHSKACGKKAPIDRR
jgi:hypothetical protein